MLSGGLAASPMPTPKNQKQAARGVARIQAFAQVFTSLIETFGWPGATVILAFGFVIAYATTDQKQRIIETYILGTGIGKVWIILVMAFLFAATSLAQDRIYRKKLATLSEEVEREGRAKSLLQEKQITKELQHAETTTAKPKRR